MTKKVDWDFVVDFTALGWVSFFIILLAFFCAALVAGAILAAMGRF